MVPVEFANFFVASTGAGAALVGLLFVAVSIAPEQTVQTNAPLERRAVASGAFLALLNAFFISLAALIPGSNLGWTALIMSLVGLLNTFTLAWNLLNQRSRWRNMLRRAFMTLLSLVLYGFELYYAVLLIQFPKQSDPVLLLTTLLMGIYGIGLLRAWELFGVQRYGLLGWLSPLCEVSTEVSTMETTREPERSHTDSNVEH